MYVASSVLDSGSSLRSARNDGIFGLSKCHSGQTTVSMYPNHFMGQALLTHTCGLAFFYDISVRRFAVFQPTELRCHAS